MNTLVPNFELQYNLSTGMDELYRKLINHGFNEEDWNGDQFIRLRTLKQRIDRLAAASRVPAYS